MKRRNQIALGISLAAALTGCAMLPPSADLDKLAVECYAAEDNFERLDRAKIVAETRGLSLPQVALAYVLSYPLDIYSLVGSATPEEIAANVVALNTKLTDAELSYLDLRTGSLA